MFRALLALLLAFPAADALAQSAPITIKVQPSGESNALEKEDIKPDIHACQVPDNQKFLAQIQLTVSSTGTPEQVHLFQGSGNTCLDDAALAAVKAASFYPALHDGVAVSQGMIKLVDMVHYDAEHAPPPKPASATIAPRVIQAPAPDPGRCKRTKPEEYSVLVSVTVRTDGLPENASVAKSSGDACFDAAAVKTALQYRFRPATQDGKAVSFPMKIQMNFDQL